MDERVKMRSCVRGTRDDDEAIDGVEAAVAVIVDDLILFAVTTNMREKVETVREREGERVNVR